VAINKAYTAARERGESKALGEAAKKEGFSLTNFGDLRYVSWGGGVPVVVDGDVAGAVGVSGLSEAEDTLLARMAAEIVAPRRKKGQTDS
jgi:glc operon protein GlcG